MMMLLKAVTSQHILYYCTYYTFYTLYTVHVPCFPVSDVEILWFAISQALFFRESKTNLFVHNRKLTDNYRNFTFIRTYYSSN